MDTNLKDLLDFDPLGTAEKLTGKYSGDDDDTVFLGMMLAQQMSARKRAALHARSDTAMGDTVERYCGIVEMNGFEKVLTIPFHSDSSGEEMFYVYAHHQGLLLVFDTYRAKHVNGGKLYYNWSPASDEFGGWPTSSGGCVLRKDTRECVRPYVWSGDHDCREALIYHIRALRDTGNFHSCWVDRPFLWLLHHQDTEVPGYEYKRINAERILMLPAWAQEMITPVGWEE